MADAGDSKSPALKSVSVRVRPPVPQEETPQGELKKATRECRLFRFLGLAPAALRRAELTPFSDLVQGEQPE